MEIELRGVTKRWGEAVAVERLDLDIADGEFVAFLGPSGCGKTTTLMMIAGIYQPTSGEIVFDGEVVNDLAPRDRRVGMVFQSYALYPHMTVAENISYSLKLQRVDKATRRRRAQEIADLMGIGHLLDRRPAELSGGQQQRVAVGRALVKEPNVLLFDEPLSNLDARLRLTMRSEIKRMQTELGITSIYVTHDQVEATTMADRIAVMREGRLEAYATPDELYQRPKTRFVAGFVGNPPMNLFDAEVLQRDGQYVAHALGIEIVVPAERGRHAAGRGTVTMGVRPEHVLPGTGRHRGEVVIVEPLGREDLIDIDVGAGVLRALADKTLGLRPGDVVAFDVDTSEVQFFASETERSLLWD